MKRPSNRVRSLGWSQVGIQWRWFSNWPRVQTSGSSAPSPWAMRSKCRPCRGAGPVGDLEPNLLARVEGFGQPHEEVGLLRPEGQGATGAVDHPLHVQPHGVQAQLLDAQSQGAQELGGRPAHAAARGVQAQVQGQLHEVGLPLLPVGPQGVRTQGAQGLHQGSPRAAAGPRQETRAEERRAQERAHAQWRTLRSRIEQARF